MTSAIHGISSTDLIVRSTDSAPFLNKPTPESNIGVVVIAVAVVVVVVVVVVSDAS